MWRLTVAKLRIVRRDGTRFLGPLGLDSPLAAEVGEFVILRDDPRDGAAVRVIYRDRFLCRAVCQELAGATVPLRGIIRARNRQRRDRRQPPRDRLQAVEFLLAAHWGHPREATAANQRGALEAIRRDKETALEVARQQDLASHPALFLQTSETLDAPPSERPATPASQVFHVATT